VYNYEHSKARIVSEHTIGLIKARFGGLREVRMQFRQKKDMIKFICAGYVLHNTLMDSEDEWGSAETAQRTTDSTGEDGERGGL